MGRLTSSLLACGLAALAACSSGNGVEATFTPGNGGFGGAGGATGGAGTGAQASTSSTSTGAATSGSGGASTSSSDAASSSSDAASSSSSAASSSAGTGGGPVCDYAAPENCFNAEEIQSIDGDQNNDLRVVTGDTSRWFQIYVFEASMFSNPMSLTVTLDVPAGMQYDLFVYTGDSSTIDCLAAPFEGEGVPSSVSLYWDDTFAYDDSFWFAIEVSYVSGNLCGPAAEWTLSVEGHTIP